MFVSLQPNAVTAALRAPLVVIIPVYNEFANIESVLTEWSDCFHRLKIDYQFLLLNDGSKDSTLEVMRRLEAAAPERLVVVDKPNSGHGRTCRLGYAAAVAAPAVEWVFQIDSDGQCDPAFFPEFWAGRMDADCLFGRRVKRDDGRARVLTSKLCRWGVRLICRCDTADPNVPYRLIRREVLAAALTRIPASFNVHNVAVTFILAKTAGVRWKHLPIRFRDRQGGSNSINLLSVAQMGVDMLLDLRRLK